MDEDTVPSHDLYETTASESEARVAGLLPTEPSEDACLPLIEIPASQRTDPGDDPRSEAHIRSVFPDTLDDRFDQSVELVLEAPPGESFDGNDIWDVMLCLGLRWGDMDCFHWDNHSEYGDQAFFSVWTSTDPGYFLPEEIAAGRVQTSDLVFGFSIPRSANPKAVFDAMLNAMEYARKRLSGRIVTSQGSPPDLESMKREIEEIASELISEGFAPGSPDALTFF